MFKKLLAGLVAVVGLTACIVPPGMSNGGFQKARTPNRAPISVGNPSNLIDGGNMVAAVNEWNAIAGWLLFDVYPVNDPYGLKNADIRFGIMTPISPPDGSRRAAWVQPIMNADNTVHHCNIWIDPEYQKMVPTSRHPDMFSHEIGHCIGFMTRPADHCEGGYEGVMSYCNFWSGMNAWWQNHDAPWWDGTDQQMLTNAGYR